MFSFGVPFQANPLRAWDPAGFIWCSSNDKYEILKIRLVRGGPAPLPGNGRDESYDGVFLEPVAPVELRRVSPDRASSLCGTRADWVELLAG